MSSYMCSASSTNQVSSVSPSPSSVSSSSSMFSFVDSSSYGGKAAKQHQITRAKSKGKLVLWEDKLPYMSKRENQTKK
jgi:hypothetical protein